MPGAPLFPFENSFARLPERLFAEIAPTPVVAPKLFALNGALALDLGLDPLRLASSEGVAALSGNSLPQGARPLAQAYAGHQFGGWNPSLGDGRAVLLGEVQGFDIQLKGAGPTPFSRGGDGRAALGPVMREYLMSEAMAALGLPTTRALAALTTGEPVYREEPLPGAILVRVASSHVRVGSFQYFAARGDVESLEALYTHTVRRLYPRAKSPAELLEMVMARQAILIARWMGLGFIHGVMNTDNMAISGETIDYGPAAFMDSYHPQTVYSAIDRGGRYAYANQPQIANWNLAQLATALVPLMPDEKDAIALFTQIVNKFQAIYQKAWLLVFGAKLGIKLEEPSLAEELLTLMAQNGADFTATFARLGKGAVDGFIEPEPYKAWEKKWRALGPDHSKMESANPLVVPRLHLIEQSIQAGSKGDFGPFEALLDAVTAPYHPTEAKFMRPPREDERVFRTYCGT